MLLFRRLRAHQAKLVASFGDQQCVVTGICSDKTVCGPRLGTTNSTSPLTSLGSIPKTRRVPSPPEKSALSPDALSSTTSNELSLSVPLATPLVGPQPNHIRIDRFSLDFEAKWIMRGPGPCDPPARNSGPFSDRLPSRLVAARHDLHDFIEQRNMPSAEPRLTANEINMAVARQIVDNVRAAKRLINTVDAVGIEIVDRCAIQ